MMFKTVSRLVSRSDARPAHEHHCSVPLASASPGSSERIRDHGRVGHTACLAAPVWGAGPYHASAGVAPVPPGVPPGERRPLHGVPRQLLHGTRKGWLLAEPWLLAV